MTDLASRLREAKEGSRELDTAVCMACFPNLRAPMEYVKGEPWLFFDEPFYKQEPPPVTTDLSAAVALVERVLPDCLVERIGCDGLLHQDGRPAVKLIWVAEIARFGETIDAEAPTAALALTLAVRRSRVHVSVPYLSLFVAIEHGLCRKRYAGRTCYPSRWPKTES